MLSRIDIKYFKMAIGSSRISSESDVDITAKCPMCGETQKHKNKKRLHLYEKNGLNLVHCFNSGCVLDSNMTVYSFLRDFYPGLLDQYKRDTFSNTMQKLSNSEDVFESYKQKDKQNQTNIVTHDLSPYINDIINAPEAINYLKKRSIFYDEKKYGKWYFGYQDLKINDKIYKITNSIIIPLYYNSNMYGFYSRNITNKFFSTYMNDVNVGYKIWNWFSIDKNKPTYIFEGIFDAISSGIENSIALLGAKIPDERLSELKDPIFVLDNDSTGLRNSLEYSKKYKVYIQPTKFKEKDMNELLKNNPFLDIKKLINDNLNTGISAQIMIKSKL